MRFQKALSGIILFMLLFTVNTTAQSQTQSMGTVKLAGPRIGATLITGKTAKDLKEEFDAWPIILQMGWQFERQFMSVEGGTTGIVEFVALVGGFEQGLLLPSLSGLMGFRSPNGSEFGFGPNLSVAGVSLALAVGATRQVGQLYLPINLALAISKKGVRISLLFGFLAKK